MSNVFSISRVWAMFWKTRTYPEVIAEQTRSGTTWRAIEDITETTIALGPFRLTGTKRHSYRIESTPSPFKQQQRSPAMEPTWSEMTTSRLPLLPGYTKTYNYKKRN
jgi:hypothetical protein